MLKGSIMTVRTRCLVAFVLLFALINIHVGHSSVQDTPLVYGKVIDIKTGLPISDAHVVFWDAEKLEQPTLGNGHYLTDKNGEYSIPAGYLRVGKTYYVYAFQGDFETKNVEYVPSNRRTIHLDKSEPRNVSFSLFPGAMVEWEGTAYLVQALSPEDRAIKMTVLSNVTVEASSMSEYGDSAEIYYINLTHRIAIIPADTSVVLEAGIWYYSSDPAILFPVVMEVFRIYNGSLPFFLHQGELFSFRIPTYSLRRGVEYAENRYVDITSQVDRAQSIGFVLFDERRSINQAHQLILEASASLSTARTDIEFLTVWRNIRSALTTFNEVSNKLTIDRQIGEAGAAYLSAIMAAFSAVLAFFLFDDNRKKFYSNIFIYAAFLIALYFIYPGAHIIIDENFLLFLPSVFISFFGIAAIVFGIPRIWRERIIEGEVSWRSAITVIFSMGKREIKRKKIRGFFTLISIVILVLAFVSLTSFGSAYGMIADKLTATAPSDGIMVKRMVNVTSPLSIPLGFSDPTALAQWTSISNVAERLKNPPDANPVVRLVNPRNGTNWVIYGVMGITPSTENMYTNLNQTVEAGGRYLSDNVLDEVLLTASVATQLGVDLGQNMTLEVLGTGISRHVTVVGLVNDNQYTNLIDMDGNSFGPLRIESGQVRRCNNTEVIFLNAATAKNIQSLIDAKYGSSAKQFVVLSDFVFLPSGGMTTEIIVPLARSIIYWLTYDVLASTNGVITYYHVGSYFELKGAAELLIPLIMVGLNVGMVMMNAVYERRKEIRILSMLGLNPTHIGLMFVAEAVILGMVGGSLGYLIGLGFSRIMVLFGQELMVREKLEWWWSAAGFALAMIASVVSSIRPAALAVSTYTPSMVKKVKRTEKQTKVRREEIFKVYQGRQLSMPVKVLTAEKEFFISFFLDRLNELKDGFVERIENVVQVPETEDIKGELVLAINFDYAFGATGRERGTKNNLVMTKSPNEDYYRVRLVSEPAVLGLPETVIERTIDLIHETCLLWAKDKGKYLGTV
jgi:ABC-type lipoprotein release transport system permease subunit